MFFKESQKHYKEIAQWGKQIYANPETGFNEFKTANYINSILTQMGYNCEKGDDIPYVKATYDTGKVGPAIAVIGEMDSIILNSEPSHACGHNVECAAMLGAALMIKKYADKNELSGKIHFMAVPAEEHIEMQHRLNLMSKGVVKYPSGKPELMHRGLFDDVDMCIMVHCMPQDNEFSLSTTANGNIIKKVIFKGKAAHAGNAPNEGINALYAANLSLSAINALRETFTEDQHARVHPIITKGGDAVNVIPSEVIIETFVRAATVKDIKEINNKVNRAFKGCAMALGCGITIEDVPGYFPIYTHPATNDTALEVAKKIFDGEIKTLGHLGLCSDIGDMSCVMPILHPYIAGVSGTLHGDDFRITDEFLAYGKSSNFLASMAFELLHDNAAKANNIINNYNPLYKDFKTYFNDVDSMYMKYEKEITDYE